MENTLFNIIINIKNGDSNGVNDLVVKFNPLLTKYANFLNYEDAKSDLILHFIETIYKFPTNRPFTDDKFILSYINKSVITSYINLSKEKSKINSKESLCEIEDWGNNKLDFHSDVYFYDLLNCLNTKEKTVVTLRYLNCLSENDIAKQLNVSRQYINRVNRQALGKIKNYIN